MVEADLYVFNKLRKSSEKIAEVLNEEEKLKQMLLINLPKITKKILYEYMDGKITGDEFWEQYKELLGLEDYFIKSLKFRLEPLIKLIRSISRRDPWIEVIPYQDEFFIKNSEKIKEDIFFQTFRTKVTGKIKIKEWLDLLYDDYKWNITHKEKVNETIVKELKKKKDCIIFYEGFIQELKKLIYNEGYKLKIKYLDQYWRSPLETLSYMIGTKGIKEIPEKFIEECIKKHIEYIEYILRNPTIDDAHRSWEKSNIKWEQ
ncbi:MAG: hypothetical protein ACTSRP_20190 [Candidatus Helarchaeota archaeon]